MDGRGFLFMGRGAVLLVCEGCDLRVRTEDAVDLVTGYQLGSEASDSLNAALFNLAIGPAPVLAKHFCELGQAVSLAMCGGFICHGAQCSTATRAGIRSVSSMFLTFFGLLAEACFFASGHAKN